MKSEPKVRASLPEGLTPERLLEMYYYMVLTRTCDDRGFALNRQGKIPFAATCQGHEAIQVGAAFALRRGVDWLVPYYRDTCLALSFGVTPREQLMCLFARKGDIFSSGRQFPNHYSVPDRQIASISSIIATLRLLFQPDDFHDTVQVSGSSCEISGPSRRRASSTSRRKPVLARTQRAWPSR